MGPRGTILIIGGAEDKGSERTQEIKQINKEFSDFEILKRMLPDAASKETIEIVTTASEVPLEVEKMYREAFKRIKFSGVKFMHISEREEAHDLELSERVENAHTVFFSGGDQFRLQTILGGTPFIDAVKTKLFKDSDFIVAGTSAGAMALPFVSIMEGGSHEALLKGDIKISSGLGIFDNCIIDTHFIKRGRFSRLAHAVIMNPNCVGIGLGEDTMLLIKNGELAECYGSGMVVIIDGYETSKTNIMTIDECEPVYVEGLIVHLLVKGCSYKIPQRKFIAPD